MVSCAQLCPYELVKNLLLETYTPTRWQLARQLRSFPHVSGVCPTTLMNQLLSILPEGDHPETMFLLLFLDRLPPHISSQLTACTFYHPRDMAAYADQICDSTPPLSAQLVAAVSSQPRSSSPASTVSMRSVSCSSCSHSPAPRHPPDYCYYHRQFGATAHHCQAPCAWLGPRAESRRCLINTTSTGGRLLHLKDELIGLLFQVDTGASRSLIPHQSTAPASGPHLITADGQPISAWGTHKQTLQIGSFHFSFLFVLAAVAFPILGNDFLAAHHLLVDPAQPAVIHCPSGCLLPLSPLIATSSVLHSLPDSSSG